MANTYCIATSTGKGFITHQDRHDFFIRGYPVNIWVVENNNAGVSWINRVNGTAKLKAEAQAIFDAEVEAGQATWDAIADEDKAPAVPHNTRPEKETLL
tara:strand:+ start:1015 stop:1311 length:297 start_codon:yes stop_codon:yes gene_type:complete